MLRRVFLRPPNGRGSNWIIVLIGLYNLYRGLTSDTGSLVLGLGLVAIGAAELLPSGRLTAAAVLRAVGLVAVLLSLLLLLARVLR